MKRSREIGAFFVRLQIAVALRLRPISLDKRQAKRKATAFCISGGDMKEIPLSKGKVALVDDEDFEIQGKFRWYTIVGKYTWYAARHDPQGKGKYGQLLLHREILLAPTGMQVDHINRNGLDCRRSNMRLATNAQNSANHRKRRDNSSGHIGVYQSHGCINKWDAMIRVNGRTKFIGSFSSIEDAARARDAMALELYGEFANLNFPNQPVERRG